MNCWTDIKRQIIGLLGAKSMTLRQLASNIKAGRRTVERAAAALREDGDIKQIGTKTYGTNPHVPIYCLTPAGAAPAERITE